MKGKLANGVGSQCPSLTRNTVYPSLLPLMRTPRLSAVDGTDAPDDLIIIIIIIIIINFNWVVTRWQWLFYMYTNMEEKEKKL